MYIMASNYPRNRKLDEITLETVWKTLTKSTKLLCDNLCPDKMLLILKTEGAVKPDDVTKIRKRDTNTEKVEALLDVLYVSPVSSYEAFMNALEQERPDLHKSVKAIEEEKIGAEVFDLESCQEEIIDFYKAEMKLVNLLPWFDEDARNMDDIYVTLELENKCRFLDNEDLVIVKTSDDTIAKRILVKGTVGSGKSTLMAKLAYTWAQRNPSSPLYKYDLVFILSLREIHPGCSIIDVIFQQILADDTDISKVALEEYIHLNPNVLFLMDGFDEYFAKSLDIVEGKIDAMMKFKTLRKACVIVSTRPHKHLGKCQKLYLPVILTGFSSQNVKLYLSKFFYNNSELVEGMSSEISKSDNLKSLSHIPVMLMLMCLLWEDSQSLPNTQSELYTEFARFLWRKFCEKDNTVCPDDDSLKCFLISLGKIAFDGLMPKGHLQREKLVFCETDFVKRELLEQGCQVGLLTKERLRSKLTVSSVVTFLHKSFQEYCASYYLANLHADPFRHTLDRIDTIREVNNKLEIRRFLCGTWNTDHVVKTIRHVIHLHMKDGAISKHSMTPTDIELILLLLFESNYPNDLTESLRSLLSQSKILKLDHLLTTDSHWHSFVKSQLASSLNQVKSVHFDLTPFDVTSETASHMTNVADVRIDIDSRNSGISANSMNQLGFCIGRLKNLSSVCLETKYAGIDITPIMRPMSVNCEFQLKTFILQSMGHSVSCDGDALGLFLIKQLGALSIHTIVTHGIPMRVFCEFRSKILKLGAAAHDGDMLCNLLANQHQLQTLILSKIKLSNETLASILDAIKVPLRELKIQNMDVGNAISHIKHIIPHLRSLELCNTGMTENDILTFGELLLNAKHLSSLNLSYNKVGKSVHVLRCVIHQLTCLYLEHADLDVNDIFTLGELLPNAKHLSSLNLSDNKVGKAVHILGCVIHQLEKLWLGNAALEENEIMVLSGFIHEAQCLRKLDLSWNRVGRAGAKRLFESLKSCNNMQELNLRITGLTVEDVSALPGSVSFRVLW